MTGPNQYSLINNELVFYELFQTFITLKFRNYYTSKENLNF